MEKIKQIPKKENLKNIIILCIASIFVCLPLLNANLNIGYDDGVQHISRLIGTYQTIEEGTFFPVIMSKFCNGFGYSWNLFYSPLTAYVPLLFKLLGVSFIACIKLFMFAVTFLSAITMYFCTKEITKNTKIAVIAGIFYIFAPYRLNDMYIRNALAELTSFVFLPMIFGGLYGILKEKPKREVGLIVGSIGLVLTHTVITMYTAILCAIYLIVQGKKLKKRNIRNKIVISAIFILMITSFFWVPLLEHKQAIDYEVFKPGRMERTEVLIAFKLNLLELFITPSHHIWIYEIGILSIILLLASPIAIKKLKKKWLHTDFYYFYLFSLIGGIVCVIMTLKIFPFEYLPSILKMIQFSYRLLEFSSFFFAFIVAVNTKLIIRKIKYRDIAMILILLILISIPFTSHLLYTEELNEERLIETVPVTANTGRVHAGCASFEYLPCKAFENRSYLETRSDEIKVIEGEAQIEQAKKENTNLTCKLSNVVENTKVELPYIYYLGYEVILKKEDKVIKLETYETENGFLGTTLPQMQEGILELHYEGTLKMKLSMAISVLGIGLGIFLLGYSFKKNRKRKQG